MWRDGSNTIDRVVSGNEQTKHDTCVQREKSENNVVSGPHVSNVVTEYFNGSVKYCFPTTATCTYVHNAGFSFVSQ